MTLPPSIANLGAPLKATPEMMMQLRAEKARHAATIEEREIQRLRSLTDNIEAHPQQALAQASVFIQTLLGNPGHIRLHRALKQWEDILDSWPVSRIASLLRETNEDTRELRETAPFARPATN
jgi:hypothetical protein